MMDHKMAAETASVSPSSTAHNDSVVISGTTDNPCRFGTNYTRAAVIAEQLFGDECRGTSIPMGLCTGAFIFIVVIIIVGYHMNKKRVVEEESAESVKTEVSPIPSDCESLLMVESCVDKIDEADEYPDVFVDTESKKTFSTSKHNSNGGPSTEPEITLTPPATSSCVKLGV